MAAGAAFLPCDHFDLGGDHSCQTSKIPRKGTDFRLKAGRFGRAGQCEYGKDLFFFFFFAFDHFC